MNTNQEKAKLEAQDLESLEIDSHGLTEGKMNTSTACANLFKAFMGIAILNLPYVAFQAGYIWAIILLSLVTLVSLRATILFVSVANDTNSKTYGQTTKIVLGQNIQKIADTMIVTNQTFLCIAYILFFTKFFSFVLAIFGIQFHMLVYYFLSLLFILPIVLWNNITFFTRISILGLILGLGSVLGTIGYEGEQLYAGSTSINDVRMVDFTSTFSCIAVFITSIEGTMVFMPIRDKMENQNESVFILGFVYLSYGLTLIFAMIFGVLCFGYSVDQMYVFNLPSNTIGYLLILAYALNILFTYPVQILPAHIVIDHLFGAVNETERNMKSFKKSLCRFVLTIFIFCAAYFIPNLNALLGILGGLLGSTLQYVFPIAMHWKFYKKQSVQQIIEYLGILVFAGSATIFGTYQSGRQLMM